ncbi:MAG: hypothetical protein ACKVWR_21455 [Acidimicrobiales bacterium]
MQTCNVVVVVGQVAQAASPLSVSGEALVSFEVVLEGPGGRREAAPVVATPELCGEQGPPPGPVVVIGRVRQRFFRVNGATQSRTEVVAERVVSGADGPEAARALAAAARRVLGAARLVGVGEGTRS